MPLPVVELIYKFDRKDRTGRIHAFGKWGYVEVLVDGWRVQEVDEVVIIPCIAEASGHKYLYEVLSHNLHKLLMELPPLSKAHTPSE